MTDEEKLTLITREAWRREDIYVSLDPPMVWLEGSQRAERFAPFDSETATRALVIEIDEAVQRLLS